MERTGLVCIVGVVGAVACGGIHDARPAQYAELKKRAAFDLRCAEQELVITPIKEQTYEGKPFFAQTAGFPAKTTRPRTNWSTITTRVVAGS